YGSLALTGKGHGTDRAILLGLEGETPEAVDVDQISSRIDRVAREYTLALLGTKVIAFDRDRHLLFHRMESLPGHPNGMRFVARDASGVELASRIYYSPGGGFVRGESDSGQADDKTFPFSSADELLQLTSGQRISISEFMLRHESNNRPDAATRAALASIWAAMKCSIDRGCATEGVLPGGLKVRRRAPKLALALKNDP